MVQEWSWYRDEDGPVLGMVWHGDSSGLGKVQKLDGTGDGQEKRIGMIQVCGWSRVGNEKRHQSLGV